MRSIALRPGTGPLLKVLIIIAMLLLFLIPLSMTRSLVGERQSLARQAAEDIIDGAGGSLSFVGPLFVVPFEIPPSNPRGTRRVRKGSLAVLPDSLTVAGHAAAEYRSKGIYRVPVYHTGLAVAGRFSIPPREAFPQGAEVDIAGIRLAAGIADMRGIRKIDTLKWGARQYAFGSDTGAFPEGSGIAAGPLEANWNETVDFSWSMEIGGGGTLSAAPLGRDSELLLSGDWGAPSFGGERLPDEREWNENGFQARWRIPEVSRPILPYWNPEENPVKFHRSQVNTQQNNHEYLEDYTLDAELLEPLGTYARTERSVKYGALILIIPFVVFFLFEVIGRVRVHPVQYLLAGAADIVFYLLLLALSEHWQFDAAYLAAAAAVTLLLSLYAAEVTPSRRSALAMPGVMAAAYLWLWVSLQSEDYALLIGAVGLFLIIAAVMFVTRKVNWYSNEPHPPARQ